MLVSNIKRIVVGGTALAMPATMGIAGEVGVQLRGDLLGVDVKSESDITGGGKSETEFNRTQFVGKRARVFIKGNPSAKTSYHVQFRFDKTADSQSFAGSTDNYDLGYWEYMHNSMFSVTMGKMNAKYGGAAGTSKGYLQDIQDNRLRKGFNRMTGASLNYMPMAGSKLELRLANPIVAANGDLGKEGEDFVTPDTPMIGILYNGTYGAIKPSFSYYMSPNGAGTVTYTNDAGTSVTDTYKKSMDTYLGVGAAYSMGMLDLGLSYISEVKEGREKNGVKDEEETTDSIHFSLEYALGKLTPMFIYENTNWEKDEASKTYNTYTVYAEYRPDEEEKGLAFYAGITSDTEEQEKVNTGVDSTTIEKMTYFVGASLNSSLKIN